MRCVSFFAPNDSGEPWRIRNSAWKADAITPLALVAGSPSVFHSGNSLISLSPRSLNSANSAGLTAVTASSLSL